MLESCGFITALIVYEIYEIYMPDYFSLLIVGANIRNIAKRVTRGDIALLVFHGGNSTYFL